MPYFVGQECIDNLDGSCVDVCPVDCIYEGDRKVYINPKECIECGACEVACPVSAISSHRTSPDNLHVLDNARFFSEPLPGRGEPLAAPGGASALGRTGVDTPFVTTLADRDRP